MKIFLIAAVLTNCSLLLGQYGGTGSVSIGIGNTTNSNLFSCTSGRIPKAGTVTATDNSIWNVPATVNFTNSAFPFASDLHNPCNGSTYTTSTEALNALNGADIVTVDSTGELITAYIFADNYFEMYINGVPVGKDNVPYTQFNSNIVRFKVNKPFTIAMLLADWEENLGIGTEYNNGFLHHAGDGGVVAIFKDANNSTVALTGSDWKAQTFYTSPIKDLTCPTENGTQRLSSGCSTSDSQDGSNYYGLHWNKPLDWMNHTFNDASWPNATIYSNSQIGVGNKPAYTNFTDIFDNPELDAQFIWSTNVVLDNEVIVRYTVQTSLGIDQNEQNDGSYLIRPNPARGQIDLELNATMVSPLFITIVDSKGIIVSSKTVYSGPIDVSILQNGLYFLRVESNGQVVNRRFIIE